MDVYLAQVTSIKRSHISRKPNTKGRIIMHYKVMLKWLSSMLLLTIVVLISASPASAVEILTDDNVEIQAGEVIDDDLYVFAETVTVNGTIQGDLIAFGANITLGPEAVVKGDLMSAGQSVTVNGTVEDDIRIAGTALIIGDSGQIGDDMLGAGYSLETKPGSAIGGSLFYAGAQALLAGDIVGDATVNTGGLQLDGMVGGDVQTEVGAAGDVPPFSPLMFIPNMPAVPNVSGGLTVGLNANIEGDLTYTAPVASDIPTGTVGGSVNHQVPAIEAEEAVPEPTIAERAFNWLIGLIRTCLTLLLIGLLVVWLLPSFIRQSVDQLQTRPLPSLGWGLVTFFGFFLVIFLLILVVIAVSIILSLITLGGLFRSTVAVGSFTTFGFVLAFLIATAYISKILVSYWGGRLILTRLSPDWGDSRFWPLFVGLVIFVILAAIPYLGWLINFLVILFGLGALILLITKLMSRKPEAAIEATTAAD
jgi:cytoskeletal protein CcmA (bactofilin family)